MDRYFHHKTLFSKPVRLRSVTEVKRRILSIQDQFLKTKLVVGFHVNQENEQNRRRVVLTTEQFLSEVEHSDNDSFVSNVKRFVDEIENPEEEEEEEEEEEMEIEEHEEYVEQSKKKNSVVTSSTTLNTSNESTGRRPSVRSVRAEEFHFHLKYEPKILKNTGTLLATHV